MNQVREKNDIQFAQHKGPVIPDHAILEKTYFESAGLWIAMVRITPKLAEHWLNFRPDSQRDKKKRLIRLLVSDIKAGWWSEKNGETIKFDINGQLIDGQHRVLSVVTSGIPITSLVVFGCQQKDIETIDAGTSRTMSDVFKISGFKDHVLLSAATSRIVQILDGGTPKNFYTPTKKAAVKFAKENITELEHSITMSRKAKDWITMSNGAALHFLYHRVDPATADTMFLEFKNPKGDRGNAIQVLKDMMVKVKNSSMTRTLAYNAYWQCAVTIKAFNAYFLCQDVKLLKYSRTERYPQIIDSAF